MQVSGSGCPGSSFETSKGNIRQHLVGTVCHKRIAFVPVRCCPGFSFGSFRACFSGGGLCDLAIQKIAR